MLKRAPYIDTPQAETAVRQHLDATAAILRQTAELSATDVVAAARIMAESIAAGGKVLVCGNGGSAADCQHFAAEFVSRLTMKFERPGIPVLALTTDTSFLTAYANDIDFDGVFARQVATFGRPGDVLLGITTSGRSRNVLQAIREAARGGLHTIALTGDDGLGTAADIVIKVPSRDTQGIQETHLGIEHMLCHLVERALYGDDGGGVR
jgi:D-sedoheptulose 7-phosphate isomerase